jgi:hypothetical protein
MVGVSGSGRDSQGLPFWEILGFCEGNWNDGLLFWDLNTVLVLMLGDKFRFGRFVCVDLRGVLSV